VTRERRPTGPVLIVEDDVDIRESLAEALEDNGIEAAVSADGQQALDYLRHAPEPPAVILLDVAMPVMDGVQFRSEQRRDPTLANIPVVVLSGTSNVDQTGGDLEADALIKKPFRLGVLLDTIRRYTTGHHHR